MVARAEYEQVGIKPLGGGFVSVLLREFRGALVRPFESKGIDVGLNLFLASGYGLRTHLGNGYSATDHWGIRPTSCTRSAGDVVQSDSVV
ncbi:MAG: hypothetical protein NVSMB62_28820 [Acidobacteriaceae bacterium]